MNKQLEDLKTGIKQLHAALDQEIDLSPMDLNEMEELMPPLSELCTNTFNLRTTLIMSFVAKQVCSDTPVYSPRTQDPTL